ncbi:ABC transporter substrate-binding protein [Dissulfuribacter thermophilus]|uniref:ABC transporter substrate-binding protein n=1 Tax=Dissulfuribacter thermophilus TaxID=1156395 RepID=A0A1B9F6E0_9BACT|nr:ABC transporter substrate-binding protein [Dissulfuribacter thermophilus]
MAFLCPEVEASIRKNVSKAISIVIINSGRQKAYLTVQKGLEDAIKKDLYWRGKRIRFGRAYNLADWINDERGLKKQIMAKRPALVFTIGTPATTFAVRNLDGIPVVYSMVTSEWRFRGAKATGVFLRVREETLVKIFTRVTRLKSIGVIHSSKWRIDPQIFSIEKAQGIRLRLFKLNSGQTLYDVLEDMKADGVYGLLMIPDTEVYDSPSTIKFVLSWALKNDIFVMGLSAAYVKMGAVLSVHIPYRSLGEQTWEIGKRILNGEDVLNIRPQYPKVIRIIVNQKLAEEKGLIVPERIMDIPVIFLK